MQDPAVFEARLRAWMASRGVVGELRVFDASCHSVEEAARAVGAPVEALVKSICLVASDGRLVVAVVKGEDRASSSRVGAALGLEARPRLASPEEMLARSGYPAGGTPPFGFEASFVVDERVLERAWVWGGGGSARALVRVGVEELVRANAGRVARVRK